MIFTPDLKKAKEFTDFICGDKLKTFQTFHDDKNEKDKFPYHNDNFSAKCIEDVFLDKILTKADKGAGIYLMINEGDGKGRRTENVIGINAIFNDADGIPLEKINEFPLKPHCVLKTSGGEPENNFSIPNYQPFWLVENFPIEQFTPTMKNMIKYFGTRKGIHDLARVMRIPGFYHQKYKKSHGKTFMVDVIYYNKELPKYTYEDFENIFKNEDMFKNESSENDFFIDLSNIPDIEPVNTEEPIEKGGRNIECSRVAGLKFNEGYTLKQVLDFCIKWNKKNKPPLSESEVKSVVKSIYKTRTSQGDEVSETPKIITEEETKNKLLQAALDYVHKEKEFYKIPEEILHPGGVWEELTDIMYENTAASHRFFNLGASLALLGTILGHKVMTQTGLRTNFYCISLGYSTAGKNAPMNMIPKICEKIQSDIVAGRFISSASALIKGLIECPVSMYLFDEIGDFMRGMKNQGSFTADIPAFLKEAFTAVETNLLKRTAGEGKLDVPWHHLSFYGASTPERFWEALTFDDVQDGFLGRSLIFESRHDAPFPRYDFNLEIDKNRLIGISNLNNMKPKGTEDIDIYKKNDKGETKKDKNGLPEKEKGNLIEQKNIPHLIKMDKESYKMFIKFSHKYHVLKNKHKNCRTGKGSIYGRAAEHAMKIALIHHMSIRGQYGVEEMIGVNSMDYSIKLVSFLIEHTVRQVESNITVNKWDFMLQSLIKYIRENSTKENPVVTYKQISNSSAMKGIRKKEVKELLDGAVSSEILLCYEMTNEKAARKTVTKAYSINPEAEVLK